MKENKNILTGILIVLSLSIFGYIQINKEESQEIEEENNVEIITPTINQVVISGKITNPINREVRFFTRDTSISTFVDFIGRFNINFPLDSSNYITFHHGQETTQMYCNPNDTISLTIDTDMFDETIKYEGSEESNYLAWFYLHNEKSEKPDVYNSTIEELTLQLDNIIHPTLKKLEVFNGTNFYESELSKHNFIRKHYTKRHAEIQNLPKAGEAAIDFTYPDIDGNMVSLSDFKGKCVYVDVWATWCGPCKAEIPYLKELEKSFHGKDIVFLSVSVDDNKEAWEKMIKEKELGGVQLFANGWSTEIMKNYSINGIPRFMLFDKDGNIISLDASRPSNENTSKMLTQSLKN